MSTVFFFFSSVLFFFWGLWDPHLCLVHSHLFSPISFLKVIAAEGEMNASRALKEASLVIAESPSALQLRYLQTLNTIAAEKNSTIIFPLPLEMMQGFIKHWGSKHITQTYIWALCFFSLPLDQQDNSVWSVSCGLRYIKLFSWPTVLLLFFYCFSISNLKVNSQPKMMYVLHLCERKDLQTSMQQQSMVLIYEGKVKYNNWQFSVSLDLGYSSINGRCFRSILL